MQDNNQNNLAEQIMDAVNHVFVGKEDVVEKLLICLLAGGHVLLEDVPGVGKTTLARVLADSIGCSMGRIQFTPDTLPTSAEPALTASRRISGNLNSPGELARCAMPRSIPSFARFSSTSENTANCESALSVFSRNAEER